MTTVTTREQAKQYLATHCIPQMFESLLSSLMIERPDDPVAFIEGKMSQIREMGMKNVNWETFVRALHPYRDPIRCENVHDGSKYDKEYEKEQRFLQPSKQTSPHLEETEDGYEPDLFHLTETS